MEIPREACKKQRKVGSDDASVARRVDFSARYMARHIYKVRKEKVRVKLVRVGKIRWGYRFSHNNRHTYNYGSVKQAVRRYLNGANDRKKFDEELAAERKVYYGVFKDAEVVQLNLPGRKVEEKVELESEDYFRDMFYRSEDINVVYRMVLPYQFDEAILPYIGSQYMRESHRGRGLVKELVTIPSGDKRADAMYCSRESFVKRKMLEQERKLSKRISIEPAPPYYNPNLSGPTPILNVPMDLGPLTFVESRRIVERFDKYMYDLRKKSIPPMFKRYILKLIDLGLYDSFHLVRMQKRWYLLPASFVYD